MTDPRSGEHDHRRETDAEFARMLEQEGLELGPGQAPREPAAGEARPRFRADRPEGGDGASEDPWSEDRDPPDEMPDPQARARSRAAHPSAGAGRAAEGEGRPPEPEEGREPLTDEEALYGDFVPPDPDLPQPSGGALWAWTALIGGFLLIVAVAVTPTLPQLTGWAGGAAALGGVVALLLRAPRTRRDDDGAEV